MPRTKQQRCHPVLLCRLWCHHGSTVAQHWLLLDYQTGPGKHCWQCFRKACGDTNLQILATQAYTQEHKKHLKLCVMARSRRPLADLCHQAATCQAKHFCGHIARCHVADDDQPPWRFIFQIGTAEQTCRHCPDSLQILARSYGFTVTIK